MSFKKVFPRALLVSILATSGLAIAAPHPLSAQNELDFFEQNTALTVFDNGVTKSNIPKLKMLREIEDKKPKLAPQAEVIDGIQKKEEVAAPSVAPLNPDTAAQASEQPQTADSILAKYGDPSKNVPVKSQPNAPAPFSAMLEAINSGEDGLAFQYARQYVRYMRDLKQTTKHAFALQRVAMEQEGLLPKGSGNMNDPFFAERAMLGDEIKDPYNQTSENSSKAVKLDPRVKDFLEMAAEKEGVSRGELDLGGPSPDVAPVKEDQQTITERARLREFFASRAPVDKKGEVNLYLFVRTNDANSKQSAKVLQQLFAKVANDQRIRIVALTIESEDSGATDIFRLNTGITFPIVGSGQFAKKAGITKAPTLVAMAKNSGATMAASGTFSLLYLEELTKHMQGGVKNGNK